MWGASIRCRAAQRASGSFIRVSVRVRVGGRGSIRVRVRHAAEHFLVEGYGGKGEGFEEF